MKKTTLFTTIGIVTAFSLVIPTVSAVADDTGLAGKEYTQSQNLEDNTFSTRGFPGNRNGMQTMFGQSNYEIAESASEIITSDTICTAKTLYADYSNAVTIVMTDSENQVKISESGTYIITGTCTDGNITVKKDTTGVVLILKDLDLTSATGATVSINKGAEVQLIIEGTVSLTDAEEPEDENSTDEEIADAFDGAVIKVKDGANAYLTGNGALIINAICKNGIKSGDEAGTCLVIDGPDITINAANDAINAGYDLTIISGTITITAADDAIHADRILTIGSDETSGPVIDINNCTEGLEGTVVNIFSGNITLTASDDGINAANKEATYASELAYSINITGGTVSVSTSGDGLDSNGNINLTGVNITIKSASNGGEAGIDFDGSYYISEDVVLNNASGVSGPDMMPGQMNGQMKGRMGQSEQLNGQTGQLGQMNVRMGDPRQMNGQMGQPGQMNSQMDISTDSQTSGSATGNADTAMQQSQENSSGITQNGMPANPPEGNPGNLPDGMPGGQGGLLGGPGGSSATITYSAIKTISSDTTESDKTISSDTADISALIVEGSTVTENNLTVNKTGSSNGGDNCNFYGQNASVLAKDGAVLYINDSYIYSNADGANGVFSYGGNGGKNGTSGDGTTVCISDTTIITEGNGSGGIMTTGGGSTYAENLTVTTSGRSSAAIRTDRGGGTVSVNGGTYTTNGLGSPAVYSTADITVKNADLVSNLSEGVVIEGKNTVTLENVNLTANNTKTNGNATHYDTIFLYQSMSGDADSGISVFSMTGGSLTSLNGEVFHVTNTNAVINLSNVSLTNKDSDNILLTVTNDGWSGADNIAAFNADSQKLEGSIIVSNATVKDDNSSRLTLNLTNSSVFEGNINTSESDKGTVNVSIDAGSAWKLTADSYVTSLTGNGCIDYNGYTLYVNGTAYTAENPLDGFKAAGTADSSEAQELSSVVFKNTSKTVKAAALESSKKTYSVIKTSGGGTVSVVKYYKNAADYIKVSSTGKVTVKKETPAGTYRIKIKVAASDGYSETTKVIKVKVK